MHSENTRDFGHSLRGSHQSTTGDFVLFADDDNWYEADAVQTVRTVVEHDFDALYVFQMRYQDDGRVLPDFKEHYEVELYNIDTGKTQWSLINCETDCPCPWIAYYQLRIVTP